MFTTRRLTTTILAIVMLGSGTILGGSAGNATAQAGPVVAERTSASPPYPAQGPNPMDPPGCWGADGIWYPDCAGPGQWGPGPGQWGPGMMGPGPWGPGMMGPGMMGPGPWGPGMMGPGMMGPGPWGP
ncbi:MAG: hypothetical protein QG661_2829, partial [Actinomycetota bacterium]|nr:hypothetical protein [Actinomycetota bacterium]